MSHVYDDLLTEKLVSDERADKAHEHMLAQGLEHCSSCGRYVKTIDKNGDCRKCAKQFAYERVLESLKELKRYELYPGDRESDGFMEEAAEGDYVKFSDIQDIIDHAEHVLKLARTK